jgi:hypothetical protein
VSTSSSPQIGFGYADGTSNHTRRTAITYPNGRVLRHEYSSGADDVLSRPSFLADDASGSVGTHLAQFDLSDATAIIRG